MITMLSRRGIRDRKSRILFPHVKKCRVKGRIYTSKYLIIFLDSELGRYNMFSVTCERKKVGNVEIPRIVIEPVLDVVEELHNATN